MNRRSIIAAMFVVPVSAGLCAPAAVAAVPDPVDKSWSGTKVASYIVGAGQRVKVSVNYRFSAHNGDYVYGGSTSATFTGSSADCSFYQSKRGRYVTYGGNSKGAYQWSYYVKAGYPVGATTSYNYSTVILKIHSSGVVTIRST